MQAPTVSGQPGPAPLALAAVSRPNPSTKGVAPSKEDLADKGEDAKPEIKTSARIETPGVVFQVDVSQEEGLKMRMYDTQGKFIRQIPEASISETLKEMGASSRGLMITTKA